MTTMENKYKTGEVVYERTNPYQKLIVSRYVDRVYYCKVQDAPKRKELVYFERELKAETAPVSVPNNSFFKIDRSNFGL